MSLYLEKCILANLDELVLLSKKTFVAAFEAVNNPADFKDYVNTAFKKEQIEKELQNRDTDFYFVRKDTLLTGYFKTNRNHAQTDVKLPESMELERIYVLESYQGQGIGGWILEEVKKLAKNAAKKFVWLGVWEENRAAIRFYERHGFVKFGTHPYYIGTDKQTDWLMRFDV